MKIKIDRVIVPPDALRKNLGDIEGLMGSIEEWGLLHPIVLNQDFVLIAGLRRLEACKRLAWDSIPFTQINVESGEVIYLAVDENIKRKPFTPSELYKVAKMIQEIEKEKAAEKQRKAGKHGKEGGRGKSKNPHGSTIHKSSQNWSNLSRAKVAKAVGVGENYLRRIGNVVEAAETDPETCGDLVRIMDESGNVSEALRQLKSRQRQAEIKMSANKAVLSDNNRVILADNMRMIQHETVDLVCTDPPYNISRDRRVEFNDRAAMSNDFGDWDWIPDDEFLRLLHDWSKEFYRVLKPGGSAYVFSSQIFLSYLRTRLISAGFHFKNVLTWHIANPKPKSDKTSWLNATDFILFGIKGSAHTFNWTSASDMRSVIAAPVCGGKERRDHPTQKPLSVVTRLIAASSKPGDLVLDPFAGSGTTGEACLRLKRSFVLIEREPAYIQIIEARTGIKHEACPG